MSKKFILNREGEQKLYKLYCEDFLSASEIGKIFNCSERPILRILKEKEWLRSGSVTSQLNNIKLKDDKKDEVIELYLQGKSKEFIGNKFGVGEKAVEKSLKRWGVKLRSNKDRKLFSEEEELYISFCYLAGDSRKKICKMFGCELSTLTNILLRNGLEITDKRIKRWKTFDTKKICEIINMYKNGNLVKDISKLFNICAKDIREILNLHNIEQRDCFLSRQEIDKFSYGISGYYKGHHFRSLNELCFIGQVLMKKYNDNEWRSGENKNDRIVYFTENGKSHFYYPDFIIKDKIIIECKPKSLWSQELVQLKCNAARIFCRQNGKKFKIIDYKKQDDFVLQEFLKGNINFYPLSLERFKNLYKDQLIKLENLSYIH